MLICGLTLLSLNVASLCHSLLVQDEEAALLNRLFYVTEAMYPLSSKSYPLRNG